MLQRIFAPIRISCSCSLVGVHVLLPRTEVDPFATFTAPVGLDFVDHVVGNMPDLGMTPAVEWYERVLQVCAVADFAVLVRNWH